MHIRALLGISPEFPLLTGSDFDNPVPTPTTTTVTGVQVGVTVIGEPTTNLHICSNYSDLDSICIKMWDSDILGQRWNNEVEQRWYSRLEENPVANPC